MNVLRIVFTVLALVMDGLCIALIGLTLLTQHLSSSGLFGVCLFLVVIVSNVPALILALIIRRSPKADSATAMVFE
jgi:hypothetical protein